MASFERTMQSARECRKRWGKTVYIYRTGAAWMYTTETFEETQAKYKRPIKDWQVLP